jgi:type I restriction enzyme S subunit
MSEVNLPREWLLTEWEELTAVDGFRRGPFGGNLKKAFFTESGYAVYEQYSPINDDCTRFRYFINEEKYNELSSFWVESGDFLISCSGTMGRITQVPLKATEGVINQALLRIRLADGIVPNFFLKLFRSPSVQDSVLTKSGGGAIQNLASVKELKQIRLPLAPEAEQKVIADKLDTLLTQVETTKARLDRIPQILKTFRQAVLASAVSGKLTEEWRNENSSLEAISLDDIDSYWTSSFAKVGKKRPNLKLIQSASLSKIPESWIDTNIGNVFDVYVGATPSRKVEDYWNGNVPWVSSSEVAFCRINSTKETVTALGLTKTSTNLHPPGTVMLAMIGQGKTRGQVAILDIEACHNQNTAALRVPANFVVSEYLYFYLTKQYEETRRVGGGNNQQALNKSFVQALDFPLPPLKEQSEIVRRVEELFFIADRIEEKANAASERINNLSQSILAKAFRGELTKTWRAANLDLISGDNSAEALLAKIKAVREKLSKKPRKKKQ